MDRSAQFMDSALPPTSSRSMTAVKLERGSHEFKITGYSNCCGIGTGKFIRSDIFEVGGHQWCLRYYPDGSRKNDEGEYVSVFAELVNATKDVQALIDIRLLDTVSRTPSAGTPQTMRPSIFKLGKWTTLGFNKFMRKKDLEAFLHDDCLTVCCNLLVVNRQD